MVLRVPDNYETATTKPAPKCLAERKVLPYERHSRVESQIRAAQKRRYAAPISRRTMAVSQVTPCAR